MLLPHPDPISGADYSAVELMPGDDAVSLLDQRLLPDREQYAMLREWQDIVTAIKDMAIRGAPAIGIAAAYGLVLAARDPHTLSTAARELRRARPTAVNLMWAVDEMMRHAQALPHGTPLRAHLAAGARELHRRDVAANRRIGELGAERIPVGAVVLTHCNAGALATGGYGTALGVIRAAHASGKRIRVIADETRPFLQGSRLTAWELARDGIPVEVIADSSAGFLMARDGVDAIVVGADRVAENGDVANKIGTYALACLAKAHARPFYVAAPWSTVDLATPDGRAIPIEERDPREVTEVLGRLTAPAGVGARNFSFDVTPASLVSALVTERGVVEPVGAAALARFSSEPNDGVLLAADATLEAR
jgi:methylthioribose-1-phosphate isomerase